MPKKKKSHWTWRTQSHKSSPSVRVVFFPILLPSCVDKLYLSPSPRCPAELPLFKSCKTSSCHEIRNYSWLWEKKITASLWIMKIIKSQLVVYYFHYYCTTQNDRLSRILNKVVTINNKGSGVCGPSLSFYLSYLLETALISENIPNFLLIKWIDCPRI